MRQLPKGYFEGILQLRDVSPEFCEKIIREINQSCKMAIATVKAQRNGVDIYVTDNHCLLAYGKSMLERHGGTLVTSRKLHSRDINTGKPIYRVTVCFRKLPYDVGDIVETEECRFKVLAIGKKVQVKDLKSGKRLLLEPEMLRKSN